MTKKNSITAADVAKKAGVSRWTVTRSFLNEHSVSEKTRKHVKEIAEEMGYSPNLLARSLISKQSGMIAIVVDNFMNYHSQTLIREISHQLQQNNLLPILVNLEHIFDLKTVKKAEQFQVDGIIFLGSFFNEYLLHLSKINNMVPLVVIGRDIEQPNVQVISIDNYDAGTQIADLLLSLSYNSFGYIGAHKNDKAKRQRFNGFKDTLQKNEKSIKLQLNISKYDSIESYIVMNEYLIKHNGKINVDSIFCENDTIAIGVIDALRQHKLNKKVAIVGFDNTHLGSSIAYQLTTIDQQVSELARKAIKAIYESQKASLLKGKLILRQSHIID